MSAFYSFSAYIGSYCIHLNLFHSFDQLFDFCSVDVNEAQKEEEGEKVVSVHQEDGEPTGPAASSEAYESQKPIPAA